MHKYIYIYIYIYISGSLSEQSLRAVCTHPVVELSVVCLEFNQNIFSESGQ